MDKDLQNALDSIQKHNPTSIFLYGSRARDDAIENSDYEVGVLFPIEQYVRRSVLNEAISNSKISVYPFKLEEFLQGNPDTPFNKSIYLREIKTTGKTLRGDRVVEGMQTPAVTLPFSNQ